MALRGVEHQLLEVMAEGAALKSHRDVEGHKIYLLHRLGAGSPSPISATVVETLYRQGLIESNQKFPVATYLLTDRGKKEVRPISLAPIASEGWNK